MQIKLIEKQHNIFRLSINGIHADLHIKPLAMYTTGLFPLPPKVKGSTLGWNIGCCFVSYNKIKAAIITLLLPMLTQAQFTATGIAGASFTGGAMLLQGNVEAGVNVQPCYGCDRPYFAMQVSYYEGIGTAIAPVIGYQMDFGSRIDMSLVPYIKLDYLPNALQKKAAGSNFGFGLRWYQYQGFMQISNEQGRWGFGVGWTWRKGHRND